MTGRTRRRMSNSADRGARTRGRRGNGPGQFRHPSGVAVDGQGNIYVVEQENHRVQKLSAAGEPLAQWGRQGRGPGEFDGPSAVAVDEQGNLYVADAGNDRVQK